METALSVLRKLPVYREHRQHIFQSDSALQWFVRKHRQALVADGALMLIAGRWHAHETNFDAYVMKSGSSAAKKQTEAA